MISAQAAIINLQGILDCDQAGTCGDGGTGTGIGNMTFDDATNMFSWNVAWSDLSGDQLFAHFHGPALPGDVAGVQVTIFGAAEPSPSIGGPVLLDAGQAADLLGGLWYINIHTSPDFGGGEIRGQVHVVPIPAAAYLFASALGQCGGCKARSAVRWARPWSRGSRSGKLVSRSGPVAARPLPPL